jgi:branched-chain amino acid aminotransferase
MKFWVGTGDDGDLVDEAQAKVSVLDHGFTVGDGIFETLKVTWEGAFAVSRHITRLGVSANAMGLAEPDADIVRIAVDEVLAANAGEFGNLGRLRITYTGGIAKYGSERGDAVPTLVVGLTAATAWPDTEDVVTVPWTRNPDSAISGVKTTSYGENVVAFNYAHERGAGEGLLANTRGELCEGTASNVFVVVDGRVLAPPLSSGCLAGITRGLVMEWFGAEERAMPIEVLTEADEIFVTSATRSVHPVVRVDDRTWSIPGPISRDLRAAFDAQAAKDIDP